MAKDDRKVAAYNAGALGWSIAGNNGVGKTHMDVCSF